MKSKPIGTLLVVLAMVFGMVAFAPAAFAQQTIQVTISKGDSADESCVTTNNCYVPDSLQISPGDTVTWTNTDLQSHTVTSGKPDNSTGNYVGAVFDSSFIKPGATFSHTFTNVGTINYFCSLHPWMTGMITVGAAAPNGTTNSTNGTGSTNATTPEFGPVAMLVLVIAVISIIAFTAKTRGIPRL